MTNPRSAVAEAGAASSMRRAAAAGVLGGSVAVAILLAVRPLLGAPGFLEVLADSSLRLVPVWLFDLGLEMFGRLAKGLVFASVCAFVLLCAAGLGIALLRSRVGRSRAVAAIAAAAAAVLVLAEFVVLPLLGNGVAGTSTTSSALALHGPLALAAVAFAVVVVGLRVRPVPAVGGDGSAPGASVADTGSRSVEGSVSRRSVLQRTLALVGLGAFGGSVVALVDRIAASATSHVIGVSGDAESTGFGVTPAVTPVDAFYWVAKDLLPYNVDVASWRLSVSGLVAKPATYSLDDLRGRPSVEGYRTLECISNDVAVYGDLIGNQRWKGVRVRDLLTDAGIAPSATHLLWRCVDGYTESLPLDVALDPRTWVVWEMGPPGTLLTAAHGAPLRALVAGRYGQKQPKYLTDLILADHDEPGYWVQRGWDRDGIVRTYSRIDFPREDGGMSDTLLFGSPLTMYGVASAGDRGISRVEVSTDDGRTWIDAELEPPGGPIGESTWTRWRAPGLTFPKPGEYALRCRATERSGALQDPQVRDPHPSGASGYARMRLSVVGDVPVIPTMPPATTAPSSSSG